MEKILFLILSCVIITSNVISKDRAWHRVYSSKPGEYETEVLKIYGDSTLLISGLSRSGYAALISSKSFGNNWQVILDESHKEDSRLPPWGFQDIEEFYYEPYKPAYLFYQQGGGLSWSCPVIC